MRINGKTRVLGIIGWPVAHSLSPVMHNAAIDALSIDFVYVPFPVEPSALGTAIQGLRRMGVWGFNVTIPHKTAVIPFLDQITGEAELAGAVNTVYRDGEFLVGHNTDGIGFLSSLRHDLGRDPAGLTVLLLGAGGASRGALAALARAGAARIIIANRTVERARELVDRFARLFPKVCFDVSSLEENALTTVLKGAGLLVNTTSVGMDGTRFDTVKLSEMRVGAGVYDMVYIPAETPLLAAAARHGLDRANGAGMLAAQGEEAFRVWTGMAPPPDFMKKILSEELGKLTKY